MDAIDWDDFTPIGEATLTDVDQYYVVRLPDATEIVIMADGRVIRED